MDRSISRLRRWLVTLGFGVAVVMGIAPAQAQELCGGVDYPFPYTDVSTVGAAFCPGIMEAYVTGVSKGTTMSTFSPNNTVTRVQMATFLQRSLDQGLARANRRAALDQWWVAQKTAAMQSIAVGGAPYVCAADGENIWVSTFSGGTVVELQASTGAILNTWKVLPNATGVRVALGKVFVATGGVLPLLNVLDPLQPVGNLDFGPIGNQPVGVAFDGANIWTANRGPPGSVSIIDPTGNDPVITITTGFAAPYGIIYDGAHIWVTDTGAGTLLQLDPSGNILKSVTVGVSPGFPAFDGANIWVPNFGDSSITVVQASTRNVVATITTDPSNQLNGPNGASFDGERILIANYGGQSVTLFKAVDLSLIANIPVVSADGASEQPISACSDGVNFWLPLQNSGNLLRF
jgi:DNA-binding beta-propeller fold protein YncE